MREAWKYSADLLALYIAMAASVVGGLWVAYLFWFAGPFPPDVLRLVPVVWFFAALTGLALGIEGVFTPGRRYPGLMSILICLPNIPFAAIFALAAMMSD